MANEFAIGKLVIARLDNTDCSQDFDPVVAADIQRGQCGEIVGGPIDLEHVDRGWELYWTVVWSDGTITDSAQKALIVIGDKGQQVEVEREEKQTV